MTITVRATGDGNCAFNAFALSLCHLIVSGEFEEKPSQQIIIINIFNAALPSQFSSINNWASIKQYLNGFDNASDIIQHIELPLAKTLREIAGNIFLLDGDQKIAYYKSLTQTTLTAAFDEFCRVKHLQQSGKNTRNLDDIYHAHQFIHDKFKTVSAMHLNPSQQKQVLSEWWENSSQDFPDSSAFENFIIEMKKNGQSAGDLELGALAEYLGLGLQIHRHNQLINLSSDNNLTSQKITLRHNGSHHWNCEIEDDEFKTWLEPLFSNSTHKNQTKNTQPDFSFSKKIPPVLHPFSSFSHFSNSSTNSPSNYTNSASHSHINTPPIVTNTFIPPTTTTTTTNLSSPIITTPISTHTLPSTPNICPIHSTPPLPPHNFSSPSPPTPTTQTSVPHVPSPTTSTALVNQPPSQPQTISPPAPSLLPLPQATQTQTTQTSPPSVHSLPQQAKNIAAQGIFNQNATSTTAKNKNQLSASSSSNNEIKIRTVSSKDQTELKKIFENQASVKTIDIENWPAKISYKSNEIKIDQVKNSNTDNMIALSTKSNNLELLKFMIDSAKKLSTDDSSRHQDVEIALNIKDKNLREQLVQYCKDQKILYVEDEGKNKNTTESTSRKQRMA